VFKEAAVQMKTGNTATRSNAMTRSQKRGLAERLPESFKSNTKPLLLLPCSYSWSPPTAISVLQGFRSFGMPRSNLDKRLVLVLFGV
jgi:hypothetical protein